MANVKSYQIILRHPDGRPLLRLIADQKEATGGAA